jgi:hypothetical protein
LLVRLWLIVVLVKIELLNTENKCDMETRVVSPEALAEVSSSLKKMVTKVEVVDGHEGVNQLSKSYM